MAVTKAILEKWLVAQKRHRLSDKQVQMARELGLNPDKLGKIDNGMESSVSAVYRGNLFQAFQMGRTENGQVAEAGHGGNGGKEKATESEERGMQETACPPFRFCGIVTMKRSLKAGFQTALFPL